MSVSDTLNGQISGSITEQTESLSGELVATGGSIMVTDYSRLTNKPMIEGVVLDGNKTFEDLHLNVLTNSELEAILI